MTMIEWALAQPADSRARALADAILSGTRVVSVDGKRVEYASMADMRSALALLFEAIGPAEVRRGARVSSARVWG